MKKKAKRMLSSFLAFMLAAVCVLPVTAGVSAAPDNLRGSLTSTSAVYIQDGYLIVSEDMTVEDVKLMFDADVQVVSGNGLAGTGAYVTVGDERMDIVLRGDVNGDGKVNSVDYLLAKRAVLGTASLEGAYYAAACYGGGSSAGPADYLKLKRHVLGVDKGEKFEKDYNGTKVAYVPLDDRPVNVDRVLYLAQSAGLDIIMPDADLYSTKLDGTGTNGNGTKLGDPQALADWLREADKSCDYFVISLDQMMSGGLVGSRYLTNTDLSAEYEIIDLIVSLSRTNTVYVFDTVMRLASTVNFNGMGQAEYNETRSYCSVARKTLSGAELTIDNIVAGYPYGTNGAEISTSLTERQKKNTFASRERKLRIIDRLLRNGGDTLEYLYIGVDDSTPNINIQTNDINYIKSLMGDNATLFAGTDELGMLSMARLVGDLYGQQVNACVRYFGGGADLAADGFDIETLRENLTKHLTSINVGVKYTSEGTDFEILVLTRCSNASYYSEQIIKRLKANIASKIPTVVIDASTDPGSGALAGALVDSELPLTMLLGYSSWNTVGNAIGIAVSQGVARLNYLKFSSEVTQASNEAFIKTMTFAYIKDITYIIEKNRYLNPSTDSDTLGNWMMGGELGGNVILSRINGKSFISDLSDYETGKVSSVRLSNFRFPWKRTFELTFDIGVTLE